MCAACGASPPLRLPGAPPEHACGKHACVVLPAAWGIAARGLPPHARVAGFRVALLEPGAVIGQRLENVKWRGSSGHPVALREHSKEVPTGVERHKIER